MRKRIWLIAAVLVCVCILTAVLLQPFGYHRILHANWKWDLPAGYTERYGVSEAGFHGDGLRYHVLQYRRAGAEALDRVFFGTEPGTDMAEIAAKVNGWLTELAVPAEEYPVYETCVCVTARQKDGSEIILLWNRAERLLYAAECFY